jgi:hypothetical protein
LSHSKILFNDKSTKKLTIIGVNDFTKTSE